MLLSVTYQTLTVLYLKQSNLLTPTIPTDQQMHYGNDAMSNQETVSIGCKFTELLWDCFIEHVRLSNNV